MNKGASKGKHRHLAIAAIVATLSMLQSKYVQAEPITAFLAIHIAVSVGWRGLVSAAASIWNGTLANFGSHR